MNTDGTLDAWEVEMGFKTIQEIDAEYWDQTALYLSDEKQIESIYVQNLYHDTIKI